MKSFSLFSCIRHIVQSHMLPSLVIVLNMSSADRSNYTRLSSSLRHGRRQVGRYTHTALPVFPPAAWPHGTREESNPGAFKPDHCHQSLSCKCGLISGRGSVLFSTDTLWSLFLWMEVIRAKNREFIFVFTAWRADNTGHLAYFYCQRISVRKEKNFI